MKTLWVFLTLFSLYFVSISARWYRGNPQAEWQWFKKNFNKSYVSNKEENYRKQIFLKNLKAINESNELYLLGKVRYAVGVNQMADLTFEERKALKAKVPRSSVTFSSETINARSVPIDLNADNSSFDLSRNTPCLSPVRDQKKCATGYAMAAVTLLEFAKCFEYERYGPFEALSLDQALDCAPNTNCCKGGNHEDVFQYFMENTIMPVADYETGNNEATKCNYDESFGIGKLDPDSLQRVENLDYGRADPSLAAYVAANLLKKYGPIAVKFDTGGRKSLFDFYQSGVYSDPNCANFVVNGKYDTDHSLVLIGVGQRNTGDFVWIAQNSFGKDWGIEGKIYLPFWKNTCNIGLDPYVINPSDPFVKSDC